MSLIFNANAVRGSEKRAMQAQWNELQNFRKAANQEVSDLLELSVNRGIAANAGQTPADTYREFDSMTKIEVVPAGHLATLTRALQQSKSINIGKEVYEFRKSSRAGSAKSSMSGQVGITLDQADYKYQGTVVPIHDTGYGRGWREVEAHRSEAFDALSDDAREADRTVLEKIEDYLWNGNADLSVKGNSWLGLRNDPSVATATLGVDLSAAATAGTDIRAEVIRIRDILRITNDCTGDVSFAVSREIMSNWEREYNASNSSNITILEMIQKLRGIGEIYEDAELSGNEVALFKLGQDGFHPVTGMALSSYALPRMKHNDDFNFIKWAAVGFIAKTSYDGKTCALYAS